MRNEELHDLYFFSDVIRIIKSWGISWVGQVVYMGENMHTGFWSGDLKERDHLEDLDIDRILILKWISKKWGQVMSSGEHRNKPSASIGCGEFLEYLRNFYLSRRNVLHGVSYYCCI
jgi:hypothetical protein